jgi:hypothetical protein
MDIINAYISSDKVMVSSFETGLSTVVPRDDEMSVRALPGYQLAGFPG